MVEETLHRQLHTELEYWIFSNCLELQPEHKLETFEPACVAPDDDKKSVI